jgi:hypothetical protein
LRQQIDVWLTSRPNRSQKLLASRAGISTTTLNDILQCRRGCSPETYEAITKALKSSGAKIVGLQEYGQPVGEEMKLNEHNMEVTRQRHVEELANRQRVNSVILEQGPRKEYVDTKPVRSKQRLSESQRREQQEFLLAKRLAQLDASDKELDSLRVEYDQLASSVLQDHLSSIDKAIWRRFVTSENSPVEYVEAPAAVVDKWQEVLDTKDDEEPVESST